MSRQSFYFFIIVLLSLGNKALGGPAATNETQGDENSSSTSAPMFPTLPPAPELPPNIASFIPSPNGPYYGFPFDVSNRLPFTVSGKCEAGKTYTITRPEDILIYQNELECVYNAGRAPLRMPEGAFYGSILSTINSRIINQFIGQFWKGKTINQTMCNGNKAYAGWNNIMGNPVSPFAAHIGHHDLNLAPGEYDNGRAAVVLEYGVDIPEACPEYKAHILDTLGKSVLRGISLSSTIPPWSQMVEVFRYIGTTEDGGDMYLGKTYMKDPYRNDRQAVTVSYFFLVNYDKDANSIGGITGLPDFNFPTTHEFKYMHPGIIDFAFRLNPIDNFLVAPARTATKLIRGLTKYGLQSFQFVSTLPFGGLRRLRQNMNQYGRRFRNGNNGAMPVLQNVDNSNVQKQPQEGLITIRLPIPSTSSTSTPPKVNPNNLNFSTKTGLPAVPTQKVANNKISVVEIF